MDEVIAFVKAYKPWTGCLENVQGFAQKQSHHDEAPLAILERMLSAQGYASAVVHMDNNLFIQCSRPRTALYEEVSEYVKCVQPLWCVSLARQSPESQPIYAVFANRPPTAPLCCVEDCRSVCCSSSLDLAISLAHRLLRGYTSSLQREHLVEKASSQRPTKR